MAIWPVSVTLEGARALRGLVSELVAVSTLEIGFAHGISALAICAGFSGRVAHHTLVDPNQRSEFQGVGLDLLRAAGVLDRTTFLEEPSHLALADLVRAGISFDFAFIDGDHRFEAVMSDLRYINELVRPGGVVVVDDIWMPSVQLSVQHFERNLGWAGCDASAAVDAFRRGENGDRFSVLRTPLVHHQRDASEFCVPF